MFNYKILDALDELLYTLASKLTHEAVLSVLKSLENLFSEFVKKAISKAHESLTWSQSEQRRLEYALLIYKKSDSEDPKQRWISISELV